MTITTTGDPATGAEASVADLLRRVGDGDAAAWREILSRYGRLVSATVRSFRLQDADALDAEQATWLRVAENTHQIQHPQRLSGWLVTTARRECLLIMRRAKHTPTLYGLVIDTVTDPRAGPERHVVAADRTRRLWSFVSQLPPRQQALLRTLFTEDYHSYAEVSRRTGIPLGGIGPTRARSVAQLRQRLERSGFGPSAW
jgi:RNA polymerase sigma factor (sigma-70 family)